MKSLKRAVKEIFPWIWLVLILLIFFSNPVVGDVTLTSFDAQPNPIYLNGGVKFNLEAESDLGLDKISLEDISTGIIKEEICGGSRSYWVEFSQEFPIRGEFEFCAWATATTGEESPHLCLNITVFTSSQCEEINLSNSVIATKIKTRKLHPEVDGFGGYPLECCPYCEELEINLSNCQLLKGSFPDYNLFYYQVKNETYTDLTFPENLYGVGKPFTLCHAEIFTGVSVFGFLDSSKYRPLDFIYNEEKLKYWLIEIDHEERPEIITDFADPKIDFLKEAALGFVDISLGKGSRVGLVKFSTSASIDSFLTDDKATLDGIINGYAPSGWTNLTDAIKKGIEVLDNDGGAHEMVLMSDGQHNVNSITDTEPVKEAARSASTKGYIIHTIALGNDADEALLGEIAAITGGDFYRVTCDSLLQDIYEYLAAQLGDTVLISDVSGSMVETMILTCLGPPEFKYGHFLAEEDISLETETKELVIVDSKAYSNAVNTLLAEESYHKQPESLECTFDCQPPCLCPCDATPCPWDCCPECHQVYDYTENVYEKYEKLWGRPYTDYLFCYRTPLKNTPWCQQRANLPTSIINYPWYSFEVKNKETYTPRNLGNIPQDYIADSHEWNEMQQVKEMPDRSVIKHITRVPESECHHNFDSKLFRTVWTKIFTPTPYLHDERNQMIWSRTGEGAIYAGGGFRREPSCWWECCRMCAPFCNCFCSVCPFWPCCLHAEFTSGVTNVMKFIIPQVKIYPTGGVTITQNAPNQVTVSNGALDVISTGNRPFEISSAKFERQQAKGVYTLTQVYTPTAGGVHPPERAQFVIAQDIIFKYDLKEEADMLSVALGQSFTTSLIDHTWGCFPGDPCNCGCCRAGSILIETTEHVEDHIGEGGSMDMKKIDALKEATNGFVDIVTPEMEVGLVSFGTTLKSSLPLTSNAADLHAEISSYAALHENTCIGCGVREAINLLSGVFGEKYIILFSDGIPNRPGGEVTGRAYAENAVDAAASQGIIVHTVAIGNSAALAFMKKLANKGGGQFYEVKCECLWDCIYQDLATKVSNAVVLVNDVSWSMDWKTSLDCPGRGPPVVHKNILRDINLSITGRIDSYERRGEFITHKGFLDITVYPDIISKFILKVKNSTLEYSSLKYPVQHELYRKEFGHGIWKPGYPYTPIDPTPEYGYLPAHQIYKMEDSYGYESRIPTAAGFEFPYPEQGKKICPANCFCPAYDLTDVTCVDYSEEPPRYYSRGDCICPERDQSFLRPLTSIKTYHGEEFYYYDFVSFYTLEINELKARDRRYKERPLSLIGGSLSGEVTHILPTTGLATTSTTTTTICSHCSTTSSTSSTTSTTILQQVSSPGRYHLNFTALQFPEVLTPHDFLNATLTVFVHFRNDTKAQTFSLYPPNLTVTPPHNTLLKVLVGFRNPSKIEVEKVEPNRYNLMSDTTLKAQVRLFNPLDGSGIPNERIKVEVEGYGISQTLLTDSSGRVIFSILLGEKSTKVNFIFPGNNRHVPSKISDYYDVASLKRIWWFLSPEVLLLVIVLVSLAFFYRWFRGGRLKVEEMKKEFKGKEK